MNHVASRLTVLTETEIDMILDTAIVILQDRGAAVQNSRLCALLRERGAQWDGGDAVRFPRQVIERFLAGIDRAYWSDEAKMSFFSVAEVCTGWYLDPLDGEEKPWNEARFADYIKVMGSLPNVDHVDLLGCHFEESPLALQPLYEKYFAFKYGTTGGSAIWDTALCAPILQMYELLAQEKQQPLGDVFQAGVYLISPLRFAREEAEQVMWFYDRGLRVGIGANGALGAGFPVTMAGALALHLAEYILISLLNQALYGDNRVHMGWSISPMDMRTGAFRYGRPEKSIANIAGAQIARRLGFGFSGPAGLTDACRPGFEAAAQKATSALLSAMACGKGYIPAGLLAVDEVFSPVQMVLDDEMLSSWKHIAGGLEVDEETLAMEAITRQVPGGNFLGDEHTAMHFRAALWEPRVYSRSMPSNFRKTRKTETDRARDKAMEAMEQGNAGIGLSQRCQRDLLRVIDSAKAQL